MDITEEERAQKSTMRRSSHATKHMLFALLVAEDLNAHISEMGDAEGGELLVKLRDHVAQALNAQTGMSHTIL